MADKRIHYVYIYFRPWNGEPCYVGMGKGSRFLVHQRIGEKHENKHFANIFKKAAGLKLPVVKVREGLTRKEAIETEIAFIKAIGRDQDGGPLVNLTDGGDGGVGMSEDGRRRISVFMSAKVKGENNPFFGKRHTEESKRLNREGHLGRPGPLRGVTGENHPWWGRHHPEEHKKMMSELFKGREVTEEWRVNISAATKVAMADPEVKARHLAAQKRRREREKSEKEKV